MLTTGYNLTIQFEQVHLSYTSLESKIQVTNPKPNNKGQLYHHQNILVIDVNELNKRENVEAATRLLALLMLTKVGGKDKTDRPCA